MIGRRRGDPRKHGQKWQESISITCRRNIFIHNINIRGRGLKKAKLNSFDDDWCLWRIHVLPSRYFSQTTYSSSIHVNMPEKKATNCSSSAPGDKGNITSQSLLSFTSLFIFLFFYLRTPYMDNKVLWNETWPLASSIGNHINYRIDLAT